MLILVEINVFKPLEPSNHRKNTYDVICQYCNKRGHNFLQC